MKRSAAIKTVLWVLLAIYAAIMLYLLFFQRALNGAFPVVSDYAAAFGGKFQLVPFRTILEYFGDVSGNAEDDKAFLAAFINLAGNVILFIPLGFFLPALSEKLRRFYKTVIAVVLIMLCVELIQAFTLLGSCDIDDLILNAAGGCIGYLIYSLAARFLEK